MLLFPLWFVTPAMPPTDPDLHHRVQIKGGMETDNMG